MNVCWRCDKPKVAGWSVPCAKCGALSCWKCGRAVEDRDQPYCGTCGTLLPGVPPAGAPDRAGEPWVTPAQPWVASTPADPLRPAVRSTPAARSISADPLRPAARSIPAARSTPADPLRPAERSTPAARSIRVAAVPAATEREDEPDVPGRLGFRLIVGSLAVVFAAAVAAFALWSAGQAEAPPNAAPIGPGAGVSPRGSASTPVAASPSPPTGGSPTASATDTAPVSPTEVVGPQSVVANPAAVVRAYFDAINRHDYQTAWDLGGRTFATTYAKFAAGFRDTVSDTVTIEAIRGNDVIVTIVALHSDGSTPRFAGIYTVRNGVLVGANVTRVSG